MQVDEHSALHTSILHQSARDTAAPSARSQHFLRGTPIRTLFGGSRRCSSRNYSRPAGEAIDADQHRANGRGEFVVPEDTEQDVGFVEYRNLCELGGFDVSGARKEPDRS